MAKRLEAPIRVMIAGVGGASLGTEIYKSLTHAKRYKVYGCDVSPTAYGLYEPGLAGTYRVDRELYVSSVIDACRDADVDWLIPGGEQPMRLLSDAVETLADAGIGLVANAPEVVTQFSDKGETFERLARSNIPIPRTIVLREQADVEYVGLPCIVKPATGSGGSTCVFYAANAEEATIYADFIRRSGSTPIAQEYVDEAEGEFTIGVLSFPDGTLAGSIALRRVLESKLSVAYRGRGGLISTGYSQGYIDQWPAVCRQAESIAAACESRGPLNIQGRVRNGVLIPFEINPRLSASTYLRALAGFNEIDILLSYLVSGVKTMPVNIRPGWYLRSLTEQFVSDDRLK